MGWGGGGGGAEEASKIPPGPGQGWGGMGGVPPLKTMTNLHNITLSRRTTTVRSNDTLVDTPFQLISGFFHVNQGILCSEHAEQASSRGVLERGGGGGQQPEVD